MRKLLLAMVLLLILVTPAYARSLTEAEYNQSLELISVSDQAIKLFGNKVINLSGQVFHPFYRITATQETIDISKKCSDFSSQVIKAMPNIDNMYLYDVYSSMANVFDGLSDMYNAVANLGIQPLTIHKDKLIEAMHRTTGYLDDYAAAKDAFKKNKAEIVSEWAP